MKTNYYKILGILLMSSPVWIGVLFLMYAVFYNEKYNGWSAVLLGLYFIPGIVILELYIFKKGQNSEESNDR